jgi:hypothetical protein
MYNDDHFSNLPIPIKRFSDLSFIVKARVI